MVQGIFLIGALYFIFQPLQAIPPQTKLQPACQEFLQSKQLTYRNPIKGTPVFLNLLKPHPYLFDQIRLCHCNAKVIFFKLM